MLKFTTPTLQHISYKNGKIAYRELGEGPVLFLLHGMNGNSQSWANLFYSLSSSYRIIAWDAPSFGASDMFGDSIDEYKNAAKALLKSLNVNNVILIGHSMGGLVATQLAVDNEISSDGLILSSTHLGFGLKKGQDLIERYSNRIKAFEEKTSELDYAINRTRRNTSEDTPEEVIQFLANIATDLRVESIRDGGRMSQETDNTNICNNLNVPVLILSGGKDKVISTDMHAALAAAIPGAKKVVFPNAGHASFAECADQFNDHVKNFAEKVWG